MTDAVLPSNPKRDMVWWSVASKLKGSITLDHLITSYCLCHHVITCFSEVLLGVFVLFGSVNRQDSQGL